MIKNLAWAVLLIPIVVIAFTIDEWYIDHQRKKIRKTFEGKTGWYTNGNTRTLH